MDDPAFEARRRDEWVLKPPEGSGGRGVVIGAQKNRREWDEAVENGQQSRWIAQVLQPIPSIRLPLLDGDKLQMRSMFCNWNPFVFGGKCAGDILRASGEAVVGITAGGALSPTIPVRRRKP